METKIENYLSTVSANLGGLSEQKVLDNLGSPKQLAKSFVGSTLSNRNNFNIGQLFKIISFYAAAGFSGMIVIPFLSILSIVLYLISFLLVGLGLVVTFGSLFGLTFPFAIINLGFWTSPDILALPITAIFAYLFYVCSKYL